MKRRGFIGRLLGGIVAAPVLVKVAEAEVAPTLARHIPGFDNLYRDHTPEQRERMCKVVREFLEEQRGFTILRDDEANPQFIKVAQVSAAEVSAVINAQTEGLVAHVNGNTVVVRAV